MSLITRRRSFAEYWKYFVARFSDVHTFDYNSAGSERIWMKFGELPSILFGAVPDRFWARSAQKREQETLQKFCFFLSGKQRTTLPISGQPNFRKFAHKTWWFWEVMRSFGIIFWKFALKGSFLQKKRDYRQRFPTSSRDFWEMITNLGKSWQVGMPMECWLSICTVGINSKSFPWPVHRPRERTFQCPICLDSILWAGVQPTLDPYAEPFIAGPLR